MNDNEEGEENGRSCARENVNEILGFGILVCVWLWLWVVGEGLGRCFILINNY